MRRGAVILCGGQSTRMGSDKAMLPFGPELMLQRVARLVGEAVEAGNIVVVAAPAQALPDLPVGVSLARDARPGRGPLEGIAAGLRALESRTDAVYVTSCDAPLLVPAFIEKMFSLLGENEVAVPEDPEFLHPLAAVYRTAVLLQINALLAVDRLRPASLFEQVSTLRVEVDDLRTVDPELATLENLNTRGDYHAALDQCGFEPRTNES